MEMDKKYYQQAGIKTIHLSDTKSFTFEPQGIVGGKWFGIHETNDPEEQAILDELASEHQGIFELTKEEYLTLAKKKALYSDDFRDSKAEYRGKTPPVVEGVNPQAAQDAAADNSPSPEPELEVDDLLEPAHVETEGTRSQAKKKAKQTKRKKDA